MAKSSPNHSWNSSDRFKEYDAIQPLLGVHSEVGLSHFLQRKICFALLRRGFQSIFRSGVPVARDDIEACSEELYKSSCDFVRKDEIWMARDFDGLELSGSIDRMIEHPVFHSTVIVV
jgi:hypothetical protein